MSKRVFGAGGSWAESLRLPQDSLGFVRRECGTCHRVFKVKATRIEGLMVFQRVAKQVTHHNDHEAQWTGAIRCCPYCAARASDDGWFTADQRTWLDKRAETLLLELRYEQLAHVERTLAANPNPTFLPVRPDAPPPALRAEPDDLRAVPLLCCQEEIKISESWPGPVHCFYCGCEHELSAALVRERAERVLKRSN